MKAAQVRATLRLGKAGITDAFIEEMRHQLKLRKVVKVRMLPPGKGDRDSRSMAAEIAAKTGTTLEDVRGHTAVFVAAGFAEKNV